MTANSCSDRIVRGNALEIAEMTAEKGLIEPGSHTLLVYNGLEVFREIYTQYSRAVLPQTGIVVIGTQYESINDAKNNLRVSNIDVERYLEKERSLLLTLNTDTGMQTPMVCGSLQ